MGSGQSSSKKSNSEKNIDMNQSAFQQPTNMSKFTYNCVMKIIFFFIKIMELLQLTLQLPSQVRLVSMVILSTIIVTYPRPILLLPAIPSLVHPVG